MKKRFDPILTVINPIYDQGPSGGQIIEGPTDPTVTYVDEFGIEYYYLTVDDGVDQNGYYYFDEDGVEHFKRSDLDPNWTPLS